jgi:kinesin family protein 18/19
MGVFGLSRGGAPTDLAVGFQSQASHSRGGDAGDPARGVTRDGSDATVADFNVAPTSPTHASTTASDGPNSICSLTVAVRTRPVLAEEQLRGVRKDILRVIDERTVVVLDPDDDKRYLDRRGGRTKERRYTYDCAFGKRATNKDVYEKTGKVLIDGVLNGRNGTVFAYGATGSGKTHTMVGDERDPGMMLLSLADIFHEVRRHGDTYAYDVSCSYLEVYNELIYDLLSGETHEDASTSLELRDDPERGATVAGLKRVKVADGDDVMELLRQGNARRKTEPTEANATSSRSHAVLEIEVVRRERHAGYTSVQSRGKLSLVDLAGSERASETLNTGHKLRDGANINRSLLALANCINALGKKSNAHGKHAENMYVPFRNSKLTRLLKESLSGNSRTAMVANVSCGSDQYAHTVNTLKYADRAKEIRTHVVQNLQTVESHIGDYQRLIDNLQGEVVRLKARVKQAEANAVRNDHDDRSVSRRSAGGLGGRGFEFRDASPTSRDASTLVGSLSARQPDGRLISGSVANARNVPNRKPVAFPPSRAALERLLESFRENAEERLETQKNLYEHEDENARVRFFLQSDGALESEAERKKCVVAVAENEAACLRYRTEIDVSDRAARALAERTKDLVSALPGFGFGHSRDARLEDERDGNEDDRESRAAVASALADALLRGRDAENAAAEAEFFLDVRESVIAEQRDAIDALVEATRGFVLRDRAGGEFLNPASENDRQRALALVSDALRKKALGERRIAFWDHQFEPPTTNANVHAAERETSETAYAYGDEKARRENETKRATHEDASRNVSPRVERVELSRKQTRVFEKRAVARDSRNSLSRRPGSGGGRAGSGRRLSSSSASELLRANGAKSETRARGIKKEEERLHEPQPRPESRESAGSGGSRASSGATTTSAVSVLSFRERSERSARAYTRGVAGKSKAPRKPPVSASGVHGSGSRLRLMQRDAFALRTSRSAETGANANGSGASDKNKNRRMVLHEPNESRAERQGLSPRGFSGRGASRRDVDVFGASGPRRFDHSISTARLNARAPVSPSRVTRRGGPQSARVSQRASPHSPAKRKPEQVTPEAFIIARPGR